MPIFMGYSWNLGTLQSTGYSMKKTKFRLWTAFYSFMTLKKKDFILNF